MFHTLGDSDFCCVWKLRDIFRHMPLCGFKCMQPVSEDTEKKPLIWLLCDLGQGEVFIVDEREKHLEVSKVERR